MADRNSRFSTLFGAVVCALFLCFFLPGSAISQAPFYQGKTITLIQGRSPGGTGDGRVRAVIPYLKKYIPGNPTIVTEYMAGGGGRKAANQIYGAARPDGLTFANVGAGLVANAVLGEAGVQYDLNKLIYLGTPNSASPYVFVTKKELGLNSIEKLRAYSGLRIGGQAVGHDIYIFGRLFAWLLDVKNPRFVTGYAGPEIDIALMGGELDGRAQLADTILQRSPDWIEKGLMDFHAIVEIPKGDKHPRFSNLPEIETFAKGDREGKLLALQRAFRLAGSPYILPPGTPKERTEILREAMSKTFKDPDFHREFKKLSGDDVTPLTGEQLEKYVKEIPREREIIALFNRLGGAEPLPTR